MREIGFRFGEEDLGKKKSEINQGSREEMLRVDKNQALIKEYIMVREREKGVEDGEVNPNKKKGREEDREEIRGQIREEDKAKEGKERRRKKNN